MRLFFALDIESAIRERISEFRNQMRAVASDVRWVAPETFHVTLQFLGDCKSFDEVERAVNSIREVPIPLAFRGAGFFPNPRAPRVFWIGIESDETLQKLVDRLGAALLPLGFERETEPYRPHLTLARSGSGRPRPVPGERPATGLQRVRDKLETLAPLEFGTMTAHEFCLYESKLTPAGAKYSKLARYPLE